MLIHGGDIDGYYNDTESNGTYSFSFANLATSRYLQSPYPGPTGAYEIARAAQSAIFDAQRRRMIIFGGYHRFCYPPPEGPACSPRYLSSTWALSYDPAVDIEQVAVAACSDGEALRDGDYVSTRPRFVLRLPGETDLDSTSTTVTLDDFVLGSAEWSRAAIVDGGCGTVETAAGIVLNLQLGEGPHRLQATLVSADGGRVGTLDRHFFAADRLRILEPRVVPHPARGRASLAFALTRSANFTLEVYDLQGRRVFASDARSAAPGETRLDWAPDAIGRAGSGVYFYRLHAWHQGEGATARGRIVFVK